MRMQYRTIIVKQYIYRQNNRPTKQSMFDSLHKTCRIYVFIHLLAYNGMFGKIQVYMHGIAQ